MRYIAPIVEGHGEVEALPALIHRIAKQLGFKGVLRVNPPIRVKSGSFLHVPEYFHRQVALAAAKAVQAAGVVLIVLDCDDSCPATLGPDLLRRAQAVRSDVDVIVTLAYREYETWFLSAARSLRELCGLPNDIDPPDNPEAIRDAKGWLSVRMACGYDPVMHQLEFTRKFDLDEARTNTSFDHFYQNVRTLLESPHDI